MATPFDGSWLTTWPPASAVNGVHGYVTGLRRALEPGRIRRALAVCRDTGDSDGEASALNNLGYCCRELGRLAEAREYCLRALAVARAAGDRWGEAIALNNLGEVLRDLGRYPPAVACLRRGLAVCAAIGDRWGEAWSRYDLGQTYHDLGRAVPAVRHYQRADGTPRDR